MENQKLPNSTAVLVLGILSILTCCCYGLFGMILAIVGLYLTHKDLIVYNVAPDKFINFSQLNTGKILCIIGIVLNAITLLYFIWIIKMIGLDALQDPALLQERLQHLQDMAR
ncbi:CCC motif membrane protein [Flavobacterium sp.]|uniref:CCC motif membrane protein n=1 Tax=Flavobacterium sp. TaxID=239 RepID=UPI00333FA688